MVSQVWYGVTGVVLWRKCDGSVVAQNAVRYHTSMVWWHRCGVGTKLGVEAMCGSISVVVSKVWG